jgi:Protein of unknown function (DUF4236)
MGFFSFRRRIKIAPGVHWNIGKKGSSISFGGRGLTHTIGAKGSRTTVGIPGTGISYTHIHSKSPGGQVATPPPLPTPAATSRPRRSSRSTFFYGLGVVLLGIWLLTKLSEIVSHNTAQISSNLAPDSGSKDSSPPSTATTPIPPKPVESVPNTKAVERTPLAYATPTVTLRAIPVEPTLNPPVRAGTTDVSTYAFPSPSPSSPNTYRVVNVQPRDFLSLRAGPGVTYGVIAKIPAGTRGIILGQIRTSNGDTMWQEVSIGRYSGFVNEIYLEAE